MPTQTPSEHYPFYRFLAVHSFLIGLFPFYIPVFLLNREFPLSIICSYIAVSALSFTITLRFWQRMVSTRSLRFLIIVSLLLVLALVPITLLAVQGHPWRVLGSAMTNGIYLCFFWMLQRTLFAARSTSQTTGRRYGNFQIFVALFLKVGILCGGLLLERDALTALLLVTTAITLAACWYFFRLLPVQTSIPWKRVYTVRESLHFKDRLRSRWMFVADAVFLFLESHFWTITLYQLSDDNFTRLGLLVIALGLVFAVLFIVVKNTIDRLSMTRLHGNALWYSAVVAYALSWMLRGLIDSSSSTNAVMLTLVIVTFFTSYFRLALNQRFFANALMAGVQPYLIYKSYWTQICTTIAFGILALAAWSLTESTTDQFIQVVYLIATPLALIYALYRLHPTRSEQKPVG